MQSLIFFHFIFNQLNAFGEDVLPCCLEKKKKKNPHKTEEDYT